MNNDEVSRRVSGANSFPLTERSALRRSRWLGHVLLMSAHHLLFRALFLYAGQGWKNRRGAQAMTWYRGKKLASGLALVGASHLLGWSPRDEDCCALETLRDMNQNRSQWHDGWHGLSVELARHKICTVKTGKQLISSCLLFFPSFIHFMWSSISFYRSADRAQLLSRVGWRTSWGDDWGPSQKAWLQNNYQS